MKARLTLRVRPGARKTEFAGPYENGSTDVWKLHVAAPPVDGKANDAIVRYLAKLTRLRANAVRIVTGHSGTNKIVELDGISGEALRRVILEAHGPRAHSGSTSPPEA
jgi:uncharacterized protein YggU (UPF0235/DUF167 family)